MRKLPLLVQTQTFGLKLVGALWLAFLLASPALAQEDDEERWYQIEVIVFGRSGETNGENWPRNLLLNYPFDWVTLQDPDNPSPTDQRASSYRRTEDPLTDNLRAPDLTRDPFYQLPEEARELNAYAKAIQEKNGHRVLYHQAWRQPFIPDSPTPALLIAGGDEYGNHYELEGSIRLTLSRYLHLNTNLWLTRFEPNRGQPPGNWPQLPKRPDEPNQDPVPSGLASRLSTESSYDDPLGRFFERSNTGMPAFFREPYLASRIVTMKQQRRMRSEELHYLDHPLMGLLIKITPYDRLDSDAEPSDGSSAS